MRTNNLNASLIRLAEFLGLRLSETLDRQQRNELAETISKFVNSQNIIPQEYATEVSAQLKGQFQPLETDVKKSLQVVIALQKIPASEREDTLTAARELFEGLTSADDFVSILKALQAIVIGERLRTVYYSKPIWKGLDSSADRLAVLDAIQRVSKEERASLVVSVLPLCQNLKCGEACASTLLRLAAVPKSQREEVVTLALKS